jgi:uracil permease
MIIIIGLGLAPVAIQNAGLDGASGWQVPLVAVITFLAVVGIASFSKGFFKIVPFVLAIVIGYIASMIFGLVPVEWGLGFIPYPDVFTGFNVFQIPNFTFLGSYSLNYTALLTFAPIAFVTLAEHIGDTTVIGEVCEEDFISDPGLDKTILGDGVATFVSAAIGGPANTTYGENTGVVALTKVGSVWVIGLAAIFAIGLGFLGYLQAFIASIPWAVIGGMTIVLYGLIAGNGVKVLIKDRTDLSNIRNIIIISTMLVIGLGGADLTIGAFSMTGMALAAVVGIILNQVLPQEI